MKSNPVLQATLNCTYAEQKVWYAANVLKAACTSSPAVLVRAAVPAIAAKPAIIAQTAKPARPASAAVTAANNTTGYGFGELYLNSPAYPIGTAIPAIPAKPASAEVIARAAIVAVPAVTALTSPAVIAIPEQSGAIKIDKSVAGQITINVKLPLCEGVGIVGSNLEKIKEFTPSALQATAFLQPGTGNSPVLNLGGDIAAETLEDYLYRNIKLCNHTENLSIAENEEGDVRRTLELNVTLYTANGFDVNSNLLQLGQIRNVANPGS